MYIRFLNRIRGIRVWFLYLFYFVASVSGFSVILTLTLIAILMFTTSATWFISVQILGQIRFIRFSPWFLYRMRRVVTCTIVVSIFIAKIAMFLNELRFTLAFTLLVVLRLPLGVSFEFGPFLLHQFLLFHTSKRRS